MMIRVESFFAISQNSALSCFRDDKNSSERTLWFFDVHLVCTASCMQVEKSCYFLEHSGMSYFFWNDRHTTFPLLTS